MNPASRIYDFLILLQKESSKNVKMLDVYKKVLNTDSIYKVFEILSFYQKNLSTIEKELEKSGKIERYKTLLNGVKTFILPTSLEPYISSHKTVLDSITPQFMVLSDGFENKKYHENDVSNDLSDLSAELDNLLETLLNSDINDKSKRLLIIVIHKIKISIDNYKYLGIEALQESILFFECILNEDEGSKHLLSKMIEIVQKAKDVTDMATFASVAYDDAREFLLGYMG